jgi:hypothetical protein
VIDQDYVQLGSHIAHGLGIVAMGGNQSAFLVEFTSYDGSKQDGNTSLFAGFQHIPAQLFVESTARFGMPIGRGFFVVVSELYQNVITRFDLVVNGSPKAFVSKTQAAASVAGVIVDFYVTAVEVGREHLSPTPFQRHIVKWFVCHGGITDGIYDYFPFGSKTKQQTGSQSQ